MTCERISVLAQCSMHSAGAEARQDRRHAFVSLDNVVAAHDRRAKRIELGLRGALGRDVLQEGRLRMPLSAGAIVSGNGFIPVANAAAAASRTLACAWRSSGSTMGPMTVSLVSAASESGQMASSRRLVLRIVGSKRATTESSRASASTQSTSPWRSRRPRLRPRLHRQLRFDHGERRLEARMASLHERREQAVVHRRSMTPTRPTTRAHRRRSAARQRRERGWPTPGSLP